MPQTRRRRWRRSSGDSTWPPQEQMTGGSSSHAAAPQAPSCVNLDDNMDDTVQFGLFNLLLHILCHSCAKLNLGVPDVYACSHERSLKYFMHSYLMNSTISTRGKARQERITILKHSAWFVV